MIAIIIILAILAYNLFSEKSPTPEINLSEVNLSECIYKKPIYIYNYTIREFSSKKEAREYANQCKEKGGLVGVCGISFLSDNLSVVCVKRNIAYFIYYCKEGIFAAFNDTVKPLNTEIATDLRQIAFEVESFLKNTQHKPYSCVDVHYAIMNFNEIILAPVRPEKS